MFVESWLAKIKVKMWQRFLPLFVSQRGNNGEPYNYYGVYFSDVNQDKYQLIASRGNTAVLEKWCPEQRAYTGKLNVTIAKLECMNVEIIHWRKQGPMRFDSIARFYANYFTRFVYVKNLLRRTKSKMFSTFSENKEMTGLDRIMLLKLLINDYVHQSAEKTHTGVTLSEVIDLLYETLWYKHIKNEEFRRKTQLLLQSLVMTEDLKRQDDRYSIEGKAISTIVAWESEAQRARQQQRIQQNIHRLMLIITASTVMITLAILAQAGIVDLHRLWERLTELNPLRLMLKLI